MATINAGRARIVYQGEFSANNAYAFLDWVTSDGSSYVCINLEGAAAGTELSNGDYWAVLAAKGENGDQGDAATIAVGSVSTGESGTQASVVNSGTVNNAILDFTIPKGEKGDKGDTATVTVGSVTTGDAGTSAIVENVGNEYNAVFNFTIPKGDKGDQGEKGETGAGFTIKGYYDTYEDLAAAITSPEAGDAYSVGTTAPYDIYIWSGNTWVNNGSLQGEQGEKGDTGAAAGFGTPTASAETLDAGASATASVTASGEDTAKVFNFTFGIPKGDTGAQGNKGDDGTPAGFGTPTASVEILAAGQNATVDVEASGDDTAKVFAFKFGIPQGADGATPTFTIGSVTTGAAGTSATVEITGTAPNYVLNFTIPQGTAGTNGTNGSDGSNAVFQILTAAPSASDINDGEVAFVVES